MGIDVEALLAPVSAEKPEGEDLEYSQEFMELDVLSRGKPEEEVGNVKKPAEDPDWKEVRRRAQELAGRTRDTRVAILLLLGLLKTEGLPGFAAGMQVLHGILERFWDTCYPKLDAEDNNDPTIRLMSLSPLAPAGDGSGDPVKLAQRLREAPLANSRTAGRFGLKDILIAGGQMPAPAAAEGQPGPADAALLEAAFKDTGAEDLQATAAAIQAAIASVGGIDEVMAEKAGPGKGPNVQDLQKLLEEMGKHVGAYMAKAGLGGAAGGDGGGDGVGGAGRGGGGGGGATPITGEILSREDAIRMMDKIISYFETYEPSSPVPLLLKRGKRLVSKTFLDVIKDLSPDALAAIQTISGTTDEEKA